jgi:dolichol-phosphate mannosyltransferase
MGDVLVVLPTYNEAETIEEVLRRTRAALPDADVLVVDDGSPDGTADLADKVGIELGRVDVMRRKARGGLGDAYRAGFAWGIERGAQVMIQMDSDLSHDPDVLPQLVAALSDSDMVIGSRYVSGGSIPEWGFHRRLLSKWGNVYAAFMLKAQLQDMTSGFRAYRTGLIEKLGLGTFEADGFGFQIEIAYRASRVGARIREVPICFVDRRAGKSKMSSDIMLEELTLVTRWGVARMARAAADRLDHVRATQPETAQR